MPNEWQEYKLVIKKPAKRGLQRLAKKLGKTHFRKLREAMADLRYEPAKKTQELYGALSSYRSFHWGRVRIIVKIVGATVEVNVVAAGWHESGARSDVYQEAIRLLESGQLKEIDDLCENDG